eukprot:9832627-Ditylum_brightwellii.AAC.1
MRIKACTWLDNLKACLNDTFDYEEIDNVTMDEGEIMRSYRSVVFEYSKDASTTYNNSIIQGDNLSSTLGAEEGQNDTIARLLKHTEALEQSQQEHRQEVKENEDIINATQKE